MNTIHYSALVLTEESRKLLVDKFPPKYRQFVGHHITHQFDVSKDCEVPDNQSVYAVGCIDSGDGLEALIVQVGLTTKRLDGGRYHITWSLDPNKYSPKDSNTLLRDIGKYQFFGEMIKIQTIPKILELQPK